MKKKDVFYVEPIDYLTPRARKTYEKVARENAAKSKAAKKPARKK